MFKFTLLLAFVFVCVHWLYRPVEYHPSEEMLNKYRPSRQMKENPSVKDSIRIAQNKLSPSEFRFLVAYE